MAALISDGVLPVEIARRLGTGKASVYRILDSRPLNRDGATGMARRRNRRKIKAFFLMERSTESVAPTIPFGARVSPWGVAFPYKIAGGCYPGSHR